MLDKVTVSSTSGSEMREYRCDRDREYTISGSSLIYPYFFIIRTSNLIPNYYQRENKKMSRLCSLLLFLAFVIVKIMDVSDECSWKKVKMPRSGDKGTLSKSSSDGEENEEERMIQPTTTTCRSQKLETIVHRTSSLLQENLPQTKNGWTALLSSLGAILLGYEVHLQTQLSRAPRVYGQIADGPMNDIYHQMASSHDSLLHKPFRPKLFIGTRAAVASTASYLFPGPTTEYVEFREIVQMTMDGATVAIDWELPVKETVDRGDTEYWINTIRHGPISQPIVLVMHGMNNHSNYGYVRSMKRACCKRGWIAAGVNMRGCGGVALTTPRTYSGAFTADLRCVVQRLSARLAPNTPMFLVGNSLSANLVCKYLGEEGLCGTLPSCVAGGAALGNPMWMQTANTDFIMSPVLALGQKKLLLENWASLCKNKEPYFKSCVRRAMRALTLLEFDEASKYSFLKKVCIRLLNIFFLQWLP